MEEGSSARSTKRKATLSSSTGSRRALPFRLRDEMSRPEAHEQSNQDVNVSMSSSSTVPSSSTESASSFSTTASSFGGPEAKGTEQNAQTPLQTSDSYSTINTFPFRGRRSHRAPPRPVFPWIMNRQDILFEVCCWLSAEDLVNLYAVSKRFHTLINRQLTTLLVGNAMARMRESATVFHFKAYKLLCIRDAAGNLSKDKNFVVRDVPSMRWLKFLEHREKVVDSIILQLAIRGFRLPRCASMVIKKVWFLMDIPENKRRIGCIHNPRLWSDADLYVACMFFMKFDMACTDPILGQGERRIRALLLAQKNLTVMDQVLKREKMRNQYEMLQMFTEWGFNRATTLQGIEHLNHVPMWTFGIRTREMGRLSHEFWQASGPYLARPDELVQKESIRRGLRFQDKLIDMMLWGSIHPATGLDIPTTNGRGGVYVRFEDEVEDEVERDIAVYAAKKDLPRVEQQEFQWT